MFMLINTKNNRQVFLRSLEAGDLEKLLEYLDNLKDDTKKRFGPHNFDKESVITFYNNQLHNAYVAVTVDTNEMIAYFILKTGYLEHDSERLRSYGLILSHTTNCTFAPSVADAWQGTGIGKQLFYFMLEQIKATTVKRIFLWGGVQATNETALAYYKKLGFVMLGYFEYNGSNWDMCYEIIT
jgi:GNAT superfamily N-acetyltransferase